MFQQERHKGTAVDHPGVQDEGVALERLPLCLELLVTRNDHRPAEPIEVFNVECTGDGAPSVDAGRLTSLKALDSAHCKAGQVGKLLLGPLVLGPEGFDDPANFFRDQQTGACGGFALHRNGVRPGRPPIYRLLKSGYVATFGGSNAPRSFTPVYSQRTSALASVPKGMGD